MLRPCHQQPALAAAARVGAPEHASAKRARTTPADPRLLRPSSSAQQLFLGQSNKVYIVDKTEK